MNFKSITFTLLFLALAASLVGADDHSRPRSAAGKVSSVLLDATGLDEAQLREAIQAGSTPAALIEANGGDVAAVADALIAEATSAIQESVAARKAELDERLTALLNGEEVARGRRLPMKRSVMLATLSEATGLDEAQLREAIGAGATPAELIEANDGDLAAVRDALLAEARGALDAAIEAQIARLGENISVMLNGERGGMMRRLIVGGNAVQAIMEEATGLDAAELREALDAGATPAELIEANGGDVSAVMDALYQEARDAHEKMRSRFDETRTRFHDMKRRFGPGLWRIPRFLAPQG